MVVLAASAVLTILIQPETRWETFADQSLASLGYYQNWELANTASNYLRAGEAVSPLQHIWSMSVQGQFYIAFLALIFSFAVCCSAGASASTCGSRSWCCSSALTIASFVYAIFAHNADQATAYYNSFARAWELLLGALLGALVPYVRWPMWLRTTVAVVALAAILSCGALIDGVKEFPGPWALVPVGATMLFILSAANRQADPHTADRLPAPNRLLATAPFVSLGAMAYSLYLWHWPLLIFWLSYTGPAAGQLPRGRDRAAALRRARLADDALRGESAALPGLGVGGRRPCRAAADAAAQADDRAGLDGRATGRCADGDVVHLARARHRAAREWQRAGESFGTRLPRRTALLNHARVPKLPMRPTVLEAKDDLPETTTDGCISDFDNSDVINCTFGDKEATRTIALAGGSHAEHWITALDQLGKLHHFKVVTYMKMGCPLTTEDDAAGDGRQPPVPGMPGVEQTVHAQAHRRSSGLRVHHLHPAVEHQAGRCDAGHLHRYLADVVGQQHSDPGHARHPVDGAQRPALLPR